MNHCNLANMNAAESLNRIKEEYKEAFTFVNKGLTADEYGQKEVAKQYYRQGESHLIKGLTIPSNSPECTGPQWDKARQMQNKMSATLNNIQTRLSILEHEDNSVVSNQTNQFSETSGPDNSKVESRLYPVVPRPCEEKFSTLTSTLSDTQPSAMNVSPTTNGSSLNVAAGLSPDAPSALNELPPVYTPEAVEGHKTISYGTESGEFAVIGGDAIGQSTHPPPLESLGIDAYELILIEQGVQIFYVTPDGQVSAPSYPGYLRVVTFSDSDAGAAQNRPPSFLQVCDWVYPLIPSQSPVLQCHNGVYMFPDIMSQDPGVYVGVVLSSELPQSDREHFEDLLRQMTYLKVQDPEASAGELNLSQTVPIHRELQATDQDAVLPEWSGKMARGILTGASWLSWGLVKGAEFTGKAIQKGASKLRTHIQPEDKPVKISPTVEKGLSVARQATGGAVKVSQFLVDGLCAVASTVGKELAPHVKKHGSKLIPEAIKKDNNSKANLDGALVVAASGVQGFATVWNGLECAAKCIAKNVAAETVHTVKHKYGSAAGKATDNAVNSAINVGVTAFNIDHLGIKAVARRTAKETGNAILVDYRLQEKPGKQDKK
ncbi:spartin a isoform X1 [Chiloscyllium plagiosum]|uniref:spartin a isoform X1 n=1 Tax=Chiloscyllium plagiosum TaxID=36176 RepID=UPI001CB87266|nr:spartin a isoform X1 [Chiloscyllium plagiosum]XP_043548012.1 spartin a isoform X1 [Chiloscyllium plagiosum]